MRGLAFSGIGPGRAGGSVEGGELFEGVGEVGHGYLLTMNRSGVEMIPQCNPKRQLTDIIKDDRYFHLKFCQHWLCNLNHLRMSCC